MHIMWTYTWHMKLIMSWICPSGYAILTPKAHMACGLVQYLVKLTWFSSFIQIWDSPKMSRASFLQNLANLEANLLVLLLTRPYLSTLRLWTGHNWIAPISLLTRHAYIIPISNRSSTIICTLLYSKDWTTKLELKELLYSLWCMFFLSFLLLYNF